MLRIQRGIPGSPQAPEAAPGAPGRPNVRRARPSRTGNVRPPTSPLPAREGVGRHRKGCSPRWPGRGARPRPEGASELRRPRPRCTRPGVSPASGRCGPGSRPRRPPDRWWCRPGAGGCPGHGSGRGAPLRRPGRWRRHAAPPPPGRRRPRGLRGRTPRVGAHPPPPRRPVGLGSVMRSRRKTRQSSRSVSWASRYQRPPEAIRCCGSTRREAAVPALVV